MLALLGLLAAAASAAVPVVEVTPAPAETVQVQPPVADEAPPLPPCCTLPALTPVRLELGATMNSKLSRAGETFPIRLTAPLDLGAVVIPAGVTGMGAVVHAAKSGFGGRPGELILAVRYLDYQGIRIPLRSLTFGAGRGNDNGDTAMAVAIAAGLAGSVIAMFITGGEVNIPEGTTLYAKVSADVVLKPIEPAAPDQPTMPATVQTEGTLKP